MRPVDSPIFHAFQTYNFTALDIAGECDTLLAQQREVADFAVQLTKMLFDLNKIITSATITSTGYKIELDGTQLLNFKSKLAKIEADLGMTEPEPAPYPSSVSSLLLRKR